MEQKFASAHIDEALGLLSGAQTLLLRCPDGFVIDRHPNSTVCQTAEQFERLGLAALEQQTGTELHYTLTEQGRAMSKLLEDFERNEQ